MFTSPVGLSPFPVDWLVSPREPSLYAEWGQKKVGFRREGLLLKGLVGGTKGQAMGMGGRKI